MWVRGESQETSRRKGDAFGPSNRIEYGESKNRLFNHQITIDVYQDVIFTTWTVILGNCGRLDGRYQEYFPTVVGIMYRSPVAIKLITGSHCVSSIRTATNCLTLIEEIVYSRFRTLSSTPFYDDNNVRNYSTRPTTQKIATKW